MNKLKPEDNKSKRNRIQLICSGIQKVMNVFRIKIMKNGNQRWVNPKIVLLIPY